MTELERIKGIRKKTVGMLEAVDITTVELLAMEDPEELYHKLKEHSDNMTVDKCRKMIHDSQELTGTGLIVKGTEIADSLENGSKLGTGVESIDRKLLDGFEQGSIVEIYGPSRGGKSQFCHQLAVMATRPMSEGGLDTEVVWISSNRSFRPLVAKVIAKRFGLDPDVSLDKVSVVEVISSQQLVRILEKVLLMCSDSVGVVIIDSLAFPEWNPYIPTHRMSYQEDKNRLYELMNRMSQFAKLTGTIFIYTNKVFQHQGNFGGIPEKPWGGHLLSHMCDYRIKMNVTRYEPFKCLKSPDQPEFKTKIVHGWGGFYKDSSEKRAAMDEIGPLIEVERGRHSHRLTQPDRNAGLVKGG